MESKIVIKERRSEKKRRKKKTETGSEGVTAEKITNVNHSPKNKHRVSALKLGEMGRTTSSSSSSLDGVLDYSPKGGNSTPPDSGERSSYIDYKDGLFCMNQQVFGVPKFCFICDAESSPLTPSVRVTGEKFHSAKRSDGVMVPIYRQLFTCSDCDEKYKDEKRVVMSRKAHEDYFKYV